MTSSAYKRRLLNRKQNSFRLCQMRLIALHFTSLQLIAKWAKSFYWKTILRRYWTSKSRMVRTRKHQRPRKMAFWGIDSLKHKKSRKWLINSREFSSILYDFQSIFVGISVYQWSLECKNYLPMQKVQMIINQPFSTLKGTTTRLASD